MKLTKLTLRDFRAFPAGKENYEFTLPNGENLLLYGENGSGKTSLYHALRAIFAPARRAADFHGFDFTHFRNVFSSPDDHPATDGHVTVEVSGNVTVPNPNFAPGGAEPPTITAPQMWPFTWGWGGGHPSAGGANFDEIARRATYLDYKALLRVHHMPDVIFQEQLFRLVIEDLLRDVELNDDKTVCEAWQELLNPPPPSEEGEELTEEEKAELPSPQKLLLTNAENFRGQVKGLLAQMEERANTILRELSPGLTARLEWPDPMQLVALGPPHAFQPPVLRLEATCFGRDISEPGPFLNEARLTALALAFYLAAADYGAPKAEAGQPDYPRLMVLDDVLIGLDLSHRLPLLRVLEKAPFDQWQVCLLTHDKAWFDLAQLQTALGSRWRGYELQAAPAQQERPGADPVVYEVPLVLAPETEDVAKHYLALARKALVAPRDTRIAGLYARVAFETKLKSYASSKSVQVGYKLDAKKMTTKDFIEAIERRLKWNGKSIRAFASIERAKLFLNGVLNPLAHCHPVTLHSGEVDAAIDAVEKLTFDEKEEKHLERAIALLPANANLNDEQLNDAAVHLRIAFEVSLRAFLKSKAGKVAYRDDWKDLPLADLWTAATERLNAVAPNALANGPAAALALDPAAHPIFHAEWTFQFVRALTEQQLRDALAALKDPAVNPPKTILDVL